MDKRLQDMIETKTKELMDSPTCCMEAKEAAQRWLDSVGTSSEKAETENYIKELEEDIMPIEQLIAFAGSDAGKNYFGADKAADIQAHGKEILNAGGKYCDCPACLIVKEILDHKDEMLK